MSSESARIDGTGSGGRQRGHAKDVTGSAPAPVTAARPRRSGRPSREEADRLDDLILEAARQSFITLGFGHTTVEGIAEQSRTTRRSVVHRFTDKDALLQAVAKRWLNRRVAEFLSPSPMTQTTDSMERLRTVCRVMVHSAASPSHYALFRVLLGEVGRLPQIAEMVIAANDAIADGIEQIVLTAQAEGKFQRYSAAAVATTATSMMSANPVNRAMLGDPQFHDRDRTDHYFNEMWNIFLLMA